MKTDIEILETKRTKSDYNKWLKELTPDQKKTYSYSDAGSKT